MEIQTFSLLSVFLQMLSKVSGKETDIILQKLPLQIYKALLSLPHKTEN